MKSEVVLENSCAEMNERSAWKVELALLSTACSHSTSNALLMYYDLGLIPEFETVLHYFYRTCCKKFFMNQRRVGRLMSV